MKAAKEGVQTKKRGVFSGELEAVIVRIEGELKGSVPEGLLRWYAVKLFERDSKVLENLKLDAAKKNAIEGLIEKTEKDMEDDTESLVTNARYAYITAACSDSVEKKGNRHELKMSDRIDRIVTSRVLGLPIFAAVMFFIYAISMGKWAVSIGTAGTDFTNDVIFGE